MVTSSIWCNKLRNFLRQRPWDRLQSEGEYFNGGRLALSKTNSLSCSQRKSWLYREVHNWISYFARPFSSGCSSLWLKEELGCSVHGGPLAESAGVVLVESESLAWTQVQIHRPELRVAALGYECFPILHHSFNACDTFLTWVTVICFDFARLSRVIGHFSAHHLLITTIALWLTWSSVTVWSFRERMSRN